MGGLEEARRVMSDTDIIDSCLFGGVLAVFKPYEKTLVEAGKGSYGYDYSDDFQVTIYVEEVLTEELFDIGLFGYTKDTFYYVLDREFSLVYKERAQHTRINGQLSYFYGLKDKDITFLNQLSVGSLFYLYFQSLSGPTLIRVILNPEPNKTQYYEYLEELRKLYSRRQGKLNNELTISTKNVTSTISLYTLDQTNLRANLTEADIVYNPETLTTTYASGQAIYLRTEKSIWFVLREPSEIVEPLEMSLQYKLLSEVMEYLLELGYTLISEDVETQLTRNDYLVFNKVIGSYVQEIRLNIEREQLVESFEFACYRRVQITNFTGSNVENIVETVNNVYYLSTASSTRSSPLRSTAALSKRLALNSSQKQRFELFADAAYL